MSSAVSLRVALAASAILSLLATSPLRAQEATTEATSEVPTDAAAMAEEEALLTPDELDALLGPVALFSDPLLAQIMTATTYPLDVVKADRFLAQNPDLTDKDRVTEANKQPWDTSVQQLAGGFPSIITRMAEHIDWTEDVGNAVLAQTEDVFDSVQRLRLLAAENGYLDSNDAQTVEVSDTSISIEPADPEVIYVPTYDTQVVYTTPAPAVPYYVQDDDDWEDAVTAGAIFFGSAIILDEIFDDNDCCGGWGGNDSIDWDRGDINVDRGDINIDGDVNIGSGDRLTNVDRTKLTTEQRDQLNKENRDKLKNVDRDKLKTGDRGRDGSGVDRVGAADRDALDRSRDKKFKPDTASRDAARNKISTKKARGDGVSTLPLPGQKAPARAASKPSKKPAVNKPAARKPSASRPTNVAKPKANKRPTAAKKPANSNAFKKSGGSRAGKASSRGRSSSGGRRR